MTYDYKSRKIVVIVSDNLEAWQSMNIVGHMAIALGANKDPELMGRDVLVDKSDVSHIGIARFGFIVKKGNSRDISLLAAKARKDIGIITIDFPREMLDTRHDDELVESLKTKLESELEYLGILLYGPTEQVNSLTKDFKLWS